VGLVIFLDAPEQQQDKVYTLVQFIVRFQPAPSAKQGLPYLQPKSPQTTGLSSTRHETAGPVSGQVVLFVGGSPKLNKSHWVSTDQLAPAA
jgi:hypothetical protein